MSTRLFADSLGTGAGASNPSVTGFQAVLAGLLSTTILNNSSSSRQAIDITAAIYGFTPAAGDVTIIEPGLNDAGHYGANSTLEAYYEGAMRSHAVWASSVVTDIVPAHATISGSGWAVQAFGSYASQNAGDSITFNTSGDSFTLGSLCQYPNGATFSVAVDGVNKGTFSTGAANVNTINNQPYGAYALSFSGLGAGTHSVVCTIVNGGSNGGAYFDWFSSHVPVAKVIIPNVYHQNVYTGALANGSNAVCDTYNGLTAALVTQLQGFGLDVHLADLATPTLTTDISSDGTHWNDSGHNKGANAYYTAITGGSIGPTLTATTIYIDSTVTPNKFYVKDSANTPHQVTVS